MLVVFTHGNSFCKLSIVVGIFLIIVSNAFPSYDYYEGDYEEEDSDILEDEKSNGTLTEENRESTHYL